MDVRSSPPATRIMSIDLNKAADWARNKRQYKHVVGAIDNLHAALSVAHEIDRAKDKLSLFFAIAPLQVAPAGIKPEPIEQDSNSASIAGCVFQISLLTYIRATHTKSDYRNKTPFADRLPPYLKPIHERLRDIRDDAIAHHGFARNSLRRPWMIEVTALEIFDDQTSTLKLHSEHANWTVSAVNDLAEVLQEAPEVAAQLVAQRRNELDKKLCEINAEDEFHNIILSSPFEPDEVYTLPQTQLDYLSGNNAFGKTSSTYDEHQIDRWSKLAQRWPTLAARIQSIP